MAITWDSIIENMNKVCFKQRHGAETVVYIPADRNLDTFSVKAHVSDFFPDSEIVPNYHGDRISCTVLHSELSAGGVSSPTLEIEGQKGDAIRRTGPEGEETWTVVGKIHRPNSREWVLTLEKNAKVVS